MARARTTSEVKNDLVKLRLPRAEKERLTEEADIAGITLSELFRSRVENKTIFSRIDLAMLRELRRIGGLLKHVHNTSAGLYSKETASALIEIRAAIRNLSNDYQEN
jgi:hypothetical protein